jgi:hypothetical protein
MLAEYKTKTNIGVGLGILLQIIARALKTAWPSTASLATLIGLLGLGLFVYGCFNYAQGKGYSRWLGLLGLLSCLGLVVLVVLPDKNKA